VGRAGAFGLGPIGDERDMAGVRLILTLHNHQPVGNFEGVFEAAYRDGYLPFLEVLEGFPDVPFVLHTSGPLLEWLADQKPEYLARLRALVDRGQVEILGGPSQEPILTMIPRRDRVGQIRAYTEVLRQHFGRAVRGMWMPERVWEQHLVADIAEAGIEYTVLDDFHFQRAGLADDALHGYYLTEDDGRLLKVFPNSERMRYLVPWLEPHEAFAYLRGLAENRPGAVVVCADDGEKFGAWPNTHEHVYAGGWLRRFCEMLRDNRDWLEATTLARAVDSTLPAGKVYLPDCSYREMTEWVLPPDRSLAFDAARKRLDGLDARAAEALRPHVRAGGFWRNFKAKYPESDEMYARMLGVSDRLAALDARGDADPDLLDAARTELYRGQCNCPYWHGAFGGLYLPHLRNAIYRALITADELLDEAEGKPARRAELAVADFNLDARQEVRLENDHLVAFVRPAQGGHIYELDVRHARANVLATLDRRPESYHATILAAARGELAGPDRPSISSQVVLKQDGLDDLLVYDRQPRKALVDHVWPVDATLDDLARCRDVERGDFAQGAYLARVRREADHVALVMERPGLADGHPIRVRKTLRLAAGDPSLDVLYELESLPAGVPIRFAVELNLAAMAGRAPDRFLADAEGERLGDLSTRLDLPETPGLSATDEWLDLRLHLGWSRPARVWSFPVETVSQSEGGFEGVYQSTAVFPHWAVVGDDQGRWSVRIRWSVGRARFAAVAPPSIASNERVGVS
jgi:alpha-amylase